MTHLQNIVSNPSIMAGKPIIAGTRITVEHVLELLSGGWTETEILKQYPHLKPGDVRAVLKYAVGLTKNEQIYPVFSYEIARG